MDKVVSTGLKMDLHIHSAASSGKDGAKVRNNTLDNIPVLVEKLNSYKVNMCAITDHDTFSYDMYWTLKQAENQENSIQKVLPGVEFSVCFSAEGKEHVIHVVTIFSDEDDSKVRKIELILKENVPNYNGAYKEENFLNLLRKIGINTILIAHQKNTLTSSTTRKNDANSVGSQKFLEFIYTDYFEAFEFKNKRNEVLNKNFLVQNNLENQLRFVTGTDCHDWSVYPSETPSNIIDEFPYTFAKCLPTFKGLIMAITDHTRLSWTNSFFCTSKSTLDTIKLSQGNEHISIPMSKGINVIIGDNSIGKSLLLHALVGYKKEGQQLLKSVKDGYKRHLQKNGIQIQPQISQGELFSFDMQGEVRAKFEEHTLNATNFLGRYFPPPVDNAPYKSIIEGEIQRLIEYLQKKFELDSKIKKLGPFNIEIFEDKPESLTFVNNISRGKDKPDKWIQISAQIATIMVQLEQLGKLDIDSEDATFVKISIEELKKMQFKYNQVVENIEAENAKMEVISTVIKKRAEKHRRTITDMQKRRAAFTENTDGLKSQLIDIILAKQGLPSYTPHLNPVKVRANTNQVNEYEFISKLGIDEINTEYFKGLIQKVLKMGKEIHWESITEEELKDSLLRYDGTSVLQFLKNALQNLIEIDMQSKNSIINQGMDKYAEMSSGLDAKIYFDLLSFETQKDGIYIIDQPEDNISQSAIRDYLLNRFKAMGEIRQVIMVSHNPQFIVNLDVDNLIFLSKKDGILQIQSGALEYTCPEYNILDIVAQNIDGGLDSIQKRWKRYDKTINL